MSFRCVQVDDDPEQHLHTLHEGICNVFQCIAVCCSVQCIAVCCSVFTFAFPSWGDYFCIPSIKGFAMWCSVLQCVAACLHLHTLHGGICNVRSQYTLSNLIVLRMCVLVCVCVCVCVCMCVCVCELLEGARCPPIHAYRHTRTHIHIFKNTNIHTHTHESCQQIVSTAARPPIERVCTLPPP